MGRLVLSVVRAAVLVAGVLAVSRAASAEILVVAPHPDDDVLMAAGIIGRAVANGETVRIVYITNGDGLGTSTGLRRGDEAVAAVAHLGILEPHLMFLGYPDGHLKTIYASYPNLTDVLTTPAGRSTTYARRGLGGTDYDTYRFGAPGIYNRASIVRALADIIERYQPQHIVTTAEFDAHTDHATTYQLLAMALAETFTRLPVYNPTLHQTPIWPNWHSPLNPAAYETQGNLDLSASGVQWSQRESLDVPLAMQSHAYQGNPKYQAIGEHYSQKGVNAYGSYAHKDEVFWAKQLRGDNKPPHVDAGLDEQTSEGGTVQLDGSRSGDPDGGPLTYSWRQVAGPPVALSDPDSSSPIFTAPTGGTRTERLVFELTVSDGELTSLPDAVSVIVRSPLERQYGANVAVSATVSASSEASGSGQLAVKAVDGVADGYPGDYTKEWSTRGQRAGAWIQLTWASPVTIGRVRLFDRPNVNDYITAARLQFSDGSTLSLGSLDNWGRQSVYEFTPRTVTSVRLLVEAVSAATQSVGLSEFIVEEVLANHLPVANAGANRRVEQDDITLLDGSGSIDVDGDGLTYRWAQTAGVAVTLANATTAQPSFRAPTGMANDEILTFELIVNDGLIDGSADTMSIVVAAPPAVGTNVASVATITASSQMVRTGQVASNVADGVVDGYPGDRTREWASAGERIGAWIDLAWGAPRILHQIVVHDRPNLNDQVLAATVQFSDGSTLAIGTLPNDGSPAVYTFASRTVTSMRLTVTAVSTTTQSIGLAELAVFGTFRSNQVPIADAGPDATVAQGVVVALDGSRSRDADGDTLTYRWTQMAGTPVALSSNSTVAPTFRTPSGSLVDEVLTFRLIVNDRQVDSSPDTVSLTVAAPTPLGFNVAPQAVATASSQTVASGQTANKANDGVADGYPGDHSREWATAGQRAGAWLQLDWPGARVIHRVVIYDRPNLGDQLLGATITFSDGTSVVVGALPNDGTPVEVRFASRSITSLRLTVTAVSTTTQNVGLAELEVYATPSTNNPPTAQAGPDQVVAQSASVQLDGSASIDPDSDPLQYRWTQVSGTPVVLSSDATARPTFTAPAGSLANETLEFRLIVNDGQLDSASDTVQITVLRAVSPASNIAPGAVVTASTQNTGSGQQAINAVDGVVSGYPVDHLREWATTGQRVGAWLELTWSAPRIVDRVVLHDRINANDQILGAVLRFSDGSEIAVGVLPNDGTGLVVAFPARATTSVRMTVTTTSSTSQSIGLAEILVYETTP